jgi:hypothetical protein
MLTASSQSLLHAGRWKCPLCKDLRVIQGASLPPLWGRVGVGGRT